MQKYAALQFKFFVLLIILLISACAKTSSPEQVLLSIAADKSFPAAALLEETIEHALQGDAESQLALGFIYFYGEGVPQDQNLGKSWWTLAAEQGCEAAQYNLGTMYKTGQGVAQDYDEAAKWFKLAAEKKYAESQQSLGFMYIKGKGCPQDYVKGYVWLSLAAEQGLEQASSALQQLKAKMSLPQVVQAREEAIKVKKLIEESKTQGA